MMKPVSPVIGDGLQDVKELFLQGKKVIIIPLANDGRLVGCSKHLGGISRHPLVTSLLLRCRTLSKEPEDDCKKDESLAIASWAF
jgi:hypothetical protein